MKTTAVAEPPRWRRSPSDGHQHLITREVDGTAEALCPLRIPATALEIGDEDDPRCPECIVVFSGSVSRLPQQPPMHSWLRRWRSSLWP